MTSRPIELNIIVAIKVHDRKDREMARNTIQKKFTTTEVHGFIIKDGQPVKVAYHLGNKCGLTTAQARIRKEEPSFAAVEVVEHEQLYKMTFDDFKKYATPCDASEDEED